MEPDDAVEQFLSLRTVEGLVDLTRDLATTADLKVILDAICYAIVEIAQFDAVAINLVSASGELEVVAVAGPPSVEDLLGTTSSRDGWDTEIASAEPHHGLLLSTDTDNPQVEVEWVNEDEAWFEPHRGDPLAWTKEHMLFSALSDSTGELIGAVSVDMPRSGLVPDAAQCATLEILIRQAETALVASQLLARSELNEQVYRLAFDSAPTLTVIARASGEFVDVNRAFADVFGQIADADSFDAATEVVDGPGGLRDSLRLVFDGAMGVTTFVAKLDHPSGPQWFQVTVRGIAHTLIKPERAVCTIVDISSERREQLRHQHDAEHDPLTGLLNRRGARPVMDLAAAPSEAGSLVLVMAGDLDGFKAANDRFGHQMGDRVLIETADRLREVMPAMASVIRLGGDEFLMLSRCVERSDAERLADSVVAAINAPFWVGRQRVELSMSLGVVIVEANEVDDIGPFVAAADRALYEAKSAGRACWVAAGPLN